MIAEHSLVVLDREFGHPRLNRGDVGTVVYVYGDGRAYEVEFVDGGGKTVALITVDASDVRRIESGELLHARRYTQGEQANPADVREGSTPDGPSTSAAG